MSSLPKEIALLEQPPRNSRTKFSYEDRTRWFSAPRKEERLRERLVDRGVVCGQGAGAASHDSLLGGCDALLDRRCVCLES